MASSGHGVFSFSQPAVIKLVGMESPIIEVENVQRVFRSVRKGEGFTENVKLLLRPDYLETPAVRDVSFSIRPGAFIGLIGANGAGKTTLLKILSGLIPPTSGRARVLGEDPFRRSVEFRRNIALVMGQKAQLWWDLPAVDAFDLLRAIYDIPADVYRERLEILSELLDVKRHLHTQIRRLSLGERMKMELIGAILHWPKVIFLDEPTIGLDVVAKQQIRDAIRFLNERDNTTIFLTSHDAGDVESLCRRVIVINHGQIIFDDRTSVLKRHFLRRKVIDVRFGEALTEPFALPGVSTLKQGTYGVKLEFDSRQMAVEQVVQQIMSAKPCNDINIADPPMEEIIREIYQA